MIHTFSREPFGLVRIMAVECMMAVMLWLSAGTLSVQAALTLIPQPSRVEERTGTFVLRANTAVTYAEGDAADVVDAARYLADALTPITGLQLKVKAQPDAKTSQGAIVLTRQDTAETLGEEGYILDVMPDRVVVRANKAAGLFYAVQTLRQLLLPKAVHPKDTTLSNRSVPCARIEDRPRFRWRGLMLDPARHFLTTDFIKRYIDLLACYKLNRLHLHLTDHQGWTIESTKYPQLTDLSRWPMRSASLASGVYTRADVCDLVAYAASRHVLLVPEIEFPGHNAIPAWVMPAEVLCSNNPYRKHEKPWDEDAAIPWLEPCAANPKALEIYQNILREVMSLFPGPYVHIGGDEYFGVAWAQCPECQKLIVTEDLRRDETEALKRLFGVSGRLGSKNKYLLYRYLMMRMCDFVRSQGRQPVLWDDMAWRGRFPKGAVVMQWHYQGHRDPMQNVATPENPAVEAAVAGHDAIISPVSHLYFDRNTSPDALYHFDPTPAGLTLEQQSHILGPHAPVWNQRQIDVDGRVLPRLYALAEIAWAPGHIRDPQEFSRRVVVHEGQRVAKLQSLPPPAIGH